MVDKYSDEWATQGSSKNPFDDDRADEKTLGSQSATNLTKTSFAFQDTEHDNHTTTSTTNALSSLPLQPHNNPSPVLTLPIKYTNIIGNYIHIFPSPAPNTQPLYTAHLKLLKPHITLSTPSPTPRKIGEINYHLLTTRIDATLNDTSLPLFTTGKLKCHYTFSSPALDGRKLTWKFRKWTSTDLVCVDDDSGVVLARFHFGGLYFMKRGRLEVLAPEVASGGAVVEGGKGRALLEELVWTCVGLVNFYVLVTSAAIA